MKTKELSNEQISQYFAEHIRYEVQQLLNATDAISRRLSIHNGLQYMIVESFTIHLRNLITFLYPYIKREEDVCARDYFINTKTWDNLRPEISITLKQAKFRADKEVEHLTTSRQAGTSKSKEWNVADLTDEIMAILKIFCESADRINLSLDFKPLWNQHIYTKQLRQSNLNP